MLLQITLKADLASPRALALRSLLFFCSSVALRVFLDILIASRIAVLLGAAEPYSQWDPWTFHDWKVPYELAALRVIWAPSTALIFARTYVYAHTPLSPALLFTANFSAHYLFFSFFHISFNPPEILQLQLAEIDRIEKVTPFDFPATCLKTIFTFTFQTLHDEAINEKLRFDALLEEELLSMLKARAQDREHRERILHWLEGQYGSTEIAPGSRESVPASASESAGSSI